MPQKIMIIGSGMAGGKIAELLSASCQKLYELSIIGDEPEGNYDRIRLAEALIEQHPENFVLNDSQWYLQHQITPYLGERAVSINRSTKTVLTSKGKELHYDKLILSLGSKPVYPEIKGLPHPGVIAFRNLNDAHRIRHELEKGKKRILIIGGGILGLELADVLNHLGHQVSLSHQLDHLMERQLSSEAAGYLKSLLLKTGIDLIMNNQVSAIYEAPSQSLVTRFQNGQEYLFDLIIVNCGIIPVTDIAQNCGLACNRGIVVNEKLQTSDPDIYALGECIEYKGKRYGIIAPVYEQCRTLNKILSGEPAVYPDTPIPPVKLKSHIPAIAMGVTEESPDDLLIEYRNSLQLIYKKLILRNNRLAGAHLIGEDLNSDALGVYYTSQLPVPGRIEELLFPGVHKPGTSSMAVYWPENVIVCDCNGIDYRTVRNSIRKNQGHLETVIKETKAGTSCGTCRPRIRSIIDNTYEAIIIGAGLGGLSSAATLARNGKKVLLIERHDKPGGYATSFTRGDFTFDVSLHNLGPLSGTLKTILDELEVTSKIRFVPFDYFQQILFPRHAFNIPKGLDEFADELSLRFPEESEGIRKLIHEMKTIRKGYEEMDRITLSGNPNELVDSMLTLDYPQFIDMTETTLKDLIYSYVHNQELAGLIGSLWWYFGLPPENLASIIYCVPGSSYIQHAGGYVEGTSQSLSNALADTIQTYHGKVLLNTEVTKLLISEKEVRGVLTDQGEVFYSDLVISNIGARKTLEELTEEDEMRKNFRKKVIAQEPSLSAIQLYLGLDCNPKDLGMTTHSYTWFSSYDHEENYQMILNGEYESSFYSATNYTDIDHTVCPPGQGILNLFSLDHIRNWENLSESEYRRKKEEVTQKILNKAEKQLPGLKKHILVRELGTPRTMIRYTGNIEGSINGPSQILEQSGLNRIKADSPIKGLYFTGSSIYPGGGYPTVINSGYKTAKQILFMEKKAQEEKVTVT